MNCLELRDLISVLSFVMALGALARTIYRDKVEPSRKEIRDLLTKLEEGIQALGSEVERHLQQTEGCLDKAAIYRLQKANRVHFDKLTSRKIREGHKVELTRLYLDWCNVLTSSPFPVGKKADKLKVGDPRLKEVDTAEAPLIQCIDRLLRSYF